MEGCCNKQQVPKSQFSSVLDLPSDWEFGNLREWKMVYVISIGLHYSHIGCHLNQLVVGSSWDKKWIACIQSHVSHYDNEIKEQYTPVKIDFCIKEHTTVYYVLESIYKWLELEQIILSTKCNECYFIISCKALQPSKELMSNGWSGLCFFWPTHIF